MEIAKLGNCVEIISGFAFSASDFNKSESGLKIIRIQNVGKYSSREFVYWDKEYKEKFLINNGDLVLSLSGSFRAEIWSQGESLLNQRIVKIIPKSNIHLNWFIHWLNNKLSFIERMGKHALVNNVGITDLKEMEISIPTLYEQKRIATILDKAEEIEATQNFAFDMRRGLINSIFESLFGTYFKNKLSFVKLGELVDSVRVAYVGSTSKYYRDEGVHFLRTGNVGHGSIITDKMKYITQEFHDSQKKSKLKTGDIIISRVIGDEIKCSVVPPELDDSNCGNVVIVTPGQQMNSIFLCHLILSHHTQRKLMKRKVGSAQSVVNTKVMKDMLVPKISIELQDQFAAIIESISLLQDSRHLSHENSNVLTQELLT